MRKKLIMIGIDGVNRDIFYSSIKNKELPFFSSLVENGIIVENAITLFPSTTVPCVASMYTGCYFKTHGILNNNWFDRFAAPPIFKGYISSPYEVLKSLDKKLFGFPDIFLPDLKTGGTINNDISKDVQTIYEIASSNGLTSYSFFHYIGRGATKWIRPRKRDMLLFAYIEKLKKGYEPFEKAMIDVVINHTKNFLPDIISIYFGCNDGNSHRNGVSDQARYFKELIDPQLLRLSEFLKRKYPDVDFYYAVCGDHGQTDFDEKDKDKVIWDNDIKNIIRLVDENLLSDGGEKLTTVDLDVIFTFGNGTAIGLYIRNKRTKNWKDEPDFEKDVAPILNTFLKVSDPEFNFPFKKDNFLDFILTRKNFDDNYKVYENVPPYKNTGKFIELEKFFEDKLTKYIEPILRIRGIDSPKGPDAIVFINYDEKKYQIGKEFKKGNHGSLFKDDSYIPMIFSGKDIKKGKLDSASIIDWMPTCAKILGLDVKKADGKVLDIFSVN